MNPSRLSWKIILWLSDQIFNANHLIFMGYGISALDVRFAWQPNPHLDHKYALQKLGENGPDPQQAQQAHDGPGQKRHAELWW